MGPGVVLGSDGAVVEYRQVDTDLVTGLAQLGGLFSPGAGVSGHELLVGLTGRQAGADRRGPGVLVHGAGHLRGPVATIRLR